MPEASSLADLFLEPEFACASRFPWLDQPCGSVPVTHFETAPCGHGIMICFEHAKTIRADISKAEPGDMIECDECGAVYDVANIQVRPL